MTCREFTGFILDYLEERLEPEARGRFDEHLAMCVNCVHYLRQYRDTIRLAQGAFADPDAPLPEEVPSDLVRAVLQAMGKSA